MYMLLKDVEDVKVSDVPSVVLIDGLRLRVQVGLARKDEHTLSRRVAVGCPPLMPILSCWTSIKFI
jgi:hypothetical protein